MSIGARQERGHVFPAPSTARAAARSKAERSGRQQPSARLALGGRYSLPLWSTCKQWAFWSLFVGALCLLWSSSTAKSSATLLSPARRCLLSKHTPNITLQKMTERKGSVQCFFTSKKTCPESEQPTARNEMSMSLQPMLKSLSSSTTRKVPAWSKVGCFDSPKWFKSTKDQKRHVEKLKGFFSIGL